MAKTFFIVGVLNTTPDSYWDGGQYVTIESAVKRAEELLSQGADIIEIGGESTGPGSVDISVQEELKRTIPVIQAIKEKFPEARLSIDTYKSEVAKAAIEAGVEMVNDITAGRADSNMFSVLANSNAQLVLMYAKDPTPRTTKEDTQYDDVISTIKEFLSKRVELAQVAGMPVNGIILDPGLGHFVLSDPKYSYEIIRRLSEIRALGFSLFVSPSRKSFLAGEENLPTEDRLPGTIVASAISVINGATYVRTHDVAEIRRGCEIAANIQSLSV